MSIPPRQLPNVYPPPREAMFPPPIPPSSYGDGSSSSSTSSRKRKRDTPSGPLSLRRSASVDSFSTNVREDIRQLDNGRECWNCGASPTDICHVIARADTDFYRLHSIGFLSFDTLGHVDNGIPLCPLCHRNFDDVLQPGFVFLPADLDFFIEWEVKDFSYRKGKYRRDAIALPRKYPCIRDYQEHCNIAVDVDNFVGGLYYRYTLRDFYPRGLLKALGNNPYPERKAWHGSPLAALRRAFLALGSRPGEFPEEVRNNLRKLQDLYEDKSRLNIEEDLHPPSEDSRDSDGDGNPGREASSRGGSLPQRVTANKGGRSDEKGVSGQAQGFNQQRGTVRHGISIDQFPIWYLRPTSPKTTQHGSAFNEKSKGTMSIANGEWGRLQSTVDIINYFAAMRAICFIDSRCGKLQRAPSCEIERPVYV